MRSRRSGNRFYVSGNDGQESRRGKPWRSRLPARYLVVRPRAGAQYDRCKATEEPITSTSNAVSPAPSPRESRLSDSALGPFHILDLLNGRSIVDLQQEEHVEDHHHGQEHEDTPKPEVIDEKADEDSGQRHGACRKRGLHTGEG